MLQKTRDLIAQGFLFNKPEELVFQPGQPWVSCQICGRVYQSAIDRKVPAGHEPENSMIAKLAQKKRKAWAEDHSKLHNEHEHMMYRLSGRFATPAASQELAAVGVFSVVDLVIDEEVKSALGESKRLPTKEVEQ